MRTLRVNAVGALLVGLSLVTGSESPVAEAAMRGDAEQVKLLLRNGADVNAAQGDGMTALHWAAENGDVELLEILVYAGAALDPVTRNNAYTPLHLASRAGHSAAVGFLLAAGANGDAATGTGTTPLHLAVASANVEAVRLLLDRGAVIDVRETAWGQTPLMWAAAYDHVEVLRLLLERGAEPVLTSRAEDIVERGEADRVALERRNARVDALASFDSREGSAEGLVRTIQELQDRQRSAQEQAAQGSEAGEQEPRPLGYNDLVGRKGGLTPLHFAARQGNRESVMALLDSGADLDQVSDGDRSSPLLLATINGHFDLAMDLVALGADTNLASDAGAAPLLAALNLHWHPKSNYPQPQAFKQQRTTYLELMEALLQAGADPDRRLERTLWYMEYNFERLSVDFAGATAFWRAAYAQDVDAMRLLVRYGADPGIPTRKMPERRFRGYDAEDVEDPSGLPPVPLGGPAAYPIHAATGVGFGEGYAGGFHRGVPGGWLPAVRYLVEELGADVNARDFNGYSPVHHAASRGDVEVIEYLVEKGADVTFVSRRGQTTADMANGPVQRVQPFPEALALLERLGAKNNNRCVSC